MSYKRRDKQEEKDVEEHQSTNESAETAIVDEIPETVEAEVQTPIPVPETPWQKSKVLLIVGDGSCLKEDMASIQSLPKCDVMAINDAVNEYPDLVTYMASWYDFDDITVSTMLNTYGHSRRPPLRGCFSLFGGKGATRVQPPYPSGCSTLYGALVGALHLGYTKIVVCNAPPLPDPESSTENTESAWQAVFPALRDVIRSVSGPTKKIFGEPTQEWLDS